MGVTAQHFLVFCSFHVSHKIQPRWREVYTRAWIQKAEDTGSILETTHHSISNRNLGSGHKTLEMSLCFPVQSLALHVTISSKPTKTSTCKILLCFRNFCRSHNAMPWKEVSLVSLIPTESFLIYRRGQSHFRTNSTRVPRGFWFLFHWKGLISLQIYFLL